MHSSAVHLHMHICNGQWPVLMKAFEYMQSIFMLVCDMCCEHTGMCFAHAAMVLQGSNGVAGNGSHGVEVEA